uniref:DDE Tnp4 domain-containing protein n=1 Tax=Clastoptera arizonana TaxID=38151 RepID=A0A1B6D1I2_9HEMI
MLIIASPKCLLDVKDDCQCRRVVENAFEIISVVFRVLRKPLLLEPDRVQKVVLACIHLHNFLRLSKSSNGTYTLSGTFDQEDPSTGQLIPGQWRIVGLPLENLLRLKKILEKLSDIAKLVRNEFCAYLNSPESSVPWQKKY